VIVAETNLLTIYDGDDPNLPMWMVFQPRSDGSTENGQSFLSGYATPTSVAMLNGIIYCSHTHNGDYWRIGLTSANFLKDSIFTNTRFGDFKYNIAARNSNSNAKWRYNVGSAQIVNNVVNDVAMAVLPNAPIDDATGLPIPTIAVGTDGGASIIRDDGSVVDITITTGANNDADRVDFTDDNRVVIQWGGDSAGEVTVDEIPSADTSANYPINLPGSHYNDNSPGSYSPIFLTEGPSQSNRHPTAIQQFRAVGTTAALSLFDENKTSEEDGMVAYATTSYNTGWMQGDIKGAFLSDTDTTNVTGSELVTNGTFASNVSGWTTGTSTITYNSGAANLARNNASNAANEIYQDITGLTVGQKYLISIKITALSNLVSVYFDPDGADPLIEPITANATGTHTAIYTATQTSGKFSINATGHSTATATVDDVSMRVAELDRSVNNKGLQVFGTITKSAVATGADLVAYSGFNSNNYLQQPVNSDFEFGTGDWAFYGWYSEPVGTSGQRTILEIGRETVAGDHIGMRHDGSNLELFISDDSFGSQDVAEYAETPNGEWRFACGLRRGNQIEIYSNGVLKVTTNIVNATNDLGDNQSYLRFGNRTYVNQPWEGSLALWRVSKSAPSAEQIKKIYEDERHLFQENAKCTLYGSSDAVTALAFDDDTDLLHVGTSSGRSDFQGLRRINNTTTAVTTAITAQNEFIIEQ